MPPRVLLNAVARLESNLHADADRREADAVLGRRARHRDEATRVRVADVRPLVREQRDARDAVVLDARLARELVADQKPRLHVRRARTLDSIDGALQQRQRRRRCARRLEVHVRGVAVEHDAELVAFTQIREQAAQAALHERKRLAVHRSRFVDDGHEVERLASPRRPVEVRRKPQCHEIARVRQRRQVRRRRFADEAQELPAAVGRGQSQVVLAEQAFGRDGVRVRNPAATDLGARELQILRAAGRHPHVCCNDDFVYRVIFFVVRLFRGGRREERRDGGNPKNGAARKANPEFHGSLQNG